MCEVEDEVEQTEFTIDELTGDARQRAMDKLYEWAFDGAWYEHTQEDWATRTLPEQWAIYGVDKDKMWFTLERRGNMALSDGRVRLQELVKLKPEMFTNLALKTACEQGWITDPLVRVYREDTTGVESLEFYYDDFSGTPFSGMESGDFWDLVSVDVFEEVLNDYIKEAAKAAWKALDEEQDYIGSKENLLENARCNEYKFDEEGRKV